MTEAELDELISCPKQITRATPARGYEEADGYKRKKLEVEGTESAGGVYSVFIRQNAEFIENFSIGLRYNTKKKHMGTVTLVRYNGPHGEESRSEDGHYAVPHIHRITADEMNSGNTEPQEKHREITDRFSSLEEALVVFFKEVGVQDYSKHFPELSQPKLGDML